VLYTFGSSTHAEVGHVLGISETAAKVRVHRARRALTDRLQEWR
jgi:RNA polymerase sigma-70 factor (ECF subfamily)